MSIIIASNDNVALERTKKEFFDKYNAHIISEYFDASDCESINNLRNKVQKYFEGSLNIVVHSIGIVERNSISNQALDSLEKIFSVNLNSAFLTVKLFQPLLKLSGLGRIIFVSSYFGSHVSKGRAAYSMSKSGMNALMKTSAVELSEENITVNSISPGGFLTDINKDILSDPNTLSQVEASIPMKRLGELE